MNSKRKGKVGELEWAAWLRENLGIDAKRGVQYCGRGAGAADVVGLPDVHFEVKRVENLNLRAAMMQSVRDAKGDDVPVVAHRRNRDEWLLTLRATDLIRLCGLIHVLARTETE